MPTLWDIQQLRPLEQIGRRRNVAFKVRGGTALRAVLAHKREPSIQTLDLFDLTPFTADVDLTHSGEATLTPSLVDEILSEVPNGECFRWDLQSAEDIQAAAGDRLYTNVLPARLIELSGVAPEVIDPANGLRDVYQASYRYFRDPRYRQSGLFRSGRNLEAFSALLYLQTLGEADIVGDEQIRQPGWRDVKEVFQTADGEIHQHLQEYPYLRSRLRRLLVNAAAPYAREDFVRTATQSGLAEFIRSVAESARIPYPLRAILEEPTAADASFCESDRIKGDTYRLEAWPGGWGFADDTLDLPRLDSSIHVVAVSPPLLLNAGDATASYGSDTEQVVPPTGQEFVHLELPEYFDFAYYSDISETDLSAFLMVSDGEWRSYPLPSVVHRRRFRGGTKERATIRMNCLGLLEEASRFGIVNARIVLVAWRAA
jgi:hypothetical protein